MSEFLIFNLLIVYFYKKYNNGRESTASSIQLVTFFIKQLLLGFWRLYLGLHYIKNILQSITYNISLCTTFFN